MKPITRIRLTAVGLSSWCLLTAVSGPARAASDPAATAFLGRNLLANGGGEQDQATPGGREVVPISGWTVEGNLTLVPYAAPDPAYGGLQPGAPVPPGAGVNFFAGGPDSAASSATQRIDLAPIAGSVDRGGIRFALAGYLGGYGGQDDQASLTATFYSAQGAMLGEATAGPVTASDRGSSDALLLRQAEGPVPTGTRTIAVKLAMTRAAGRYNDGYADELSFTLSGLGEPAVAPPTPTERGRATAAPGLLNRNLIANGGGEQDTATPGGREVVPISSWTVEGNTTLVPYDAPDAAYGGIRAGAPIPPMAGRNFFAGGPDNAASAATQVVDVAAAAAPIDASGVRYSLSGYFGGDTDQDDQAELVAVFRNAGGTTLGQARVGPVLRADRGAGGGLLLRETAGAVPAGTRSIVVRLAMTRVAGRYNDGYADELALVLTSAGAGDAAAARPGDAAEISPCPAILGDFLQLMADGREEEAMRLATGQFRQTSSDERQAVREMVRLIATAQPDGVRVNAVGAAVTHVIARLRLATGDSAVLIATFHGSQIDQLDWRNHP